MRALVVVIAGLAACQTVELSDTSQAVTTAPISSINFGTIQVGSTSAAQGAYIRETTNNGADTISQLLYNGSTSPAACPDFTVNAPLPGYPEKDCETTCITTQCPVAPVGQICTTYDYDFTATFHPSIAAGESCQLTFVGTGGNNVISLSGTGSPPPIHVGASPGSLAFGGVRINTASSAIGVSVVNSGGATATINSVSVTGGFAIVSGNTGSHALGAGAGEGFSVTCNPSGVGAVNGTFNLSSNDPSTPNISLPMSCNGIDSALAISPSPAVLTTLRVGESEQKQITITNMGGAATSIQNVTVTGMTMVDAPPAGTALGAGGMATATIEFDATQKGDVSGTLHVDYDNGKSVDTQITARAVNVALSLTPDGDIDLGNVCVGQTKEQDFKLIGTDEGSFALTAASTATPDDTTFALTTPTLPVTVQGAAANTVSLSLTAAPAVAGDATTVVTLTTDMPGAPPHAINVHALGLEAGVNGPPQVDLGGNQINMTSIGRHVEISNCTDAPVTITAVQISGTDLTEFAIVDQPQSSTIPPYGSASWLVVLQAHTEGEKAASFDATTDSGAVTSVPLIGEGLGSGIGSDGSVDTTKSSYYACSTGTPTSLWPIALALGGLCVRRRRRR
ncbi:MAG: choice-of-anchor D domain-containing protein [Kofleriaceae bacterium]